MRTFLVYIASLTRHFAVTPVSCYTRTIHAEKLPALCFGNCFFGNRTSCSAHAVFIAEVASDIPFWKKHAPCERVNGHVLKSLNRWHVCRETVCQKNDRLRTGSLSIFFTPHPRLFCMQLSKGYYGWLFRQWDTKCHCSTLKSSRWMAVSAAKYRVSETIRRFLFAFLFRSRGYWILAGKLRGMNCEMCAAEQWSWNFRLVKFDKSAEKNDSGIDDVGCL